MATRDIVIPILALTPHGGLRILIEIANELSKKHHKVTILTSNYISSIPFFIESSVNVKKIGFKTKNKYFAGLMFFLLCTFFLKRKIILANFFLTVIPAWLASRALGAEYIYLVQDMEYGFFQKRRHFILRHICLWTYRSVNIVAANRYLAHQLSAFTNVSVTLNLGVSKIFHETKIEFEKIKKYDVIYFLRRQPLKRLDRFDEILKKLHYLELNVLCVSQDEELLKNYSEKCAVFQPKSDLDLISAIDSSRLLLLTSEHEGFALPPLEAMARGVPCVMFECGGPSVYAAHGENALIVSDDSTDTAAAYISEVVKDEQRYRRLSKKSIETSHRFKIETAVNQILVFINSKNTPNINTKNI